MAFHPMLNMIASLDIFGDKIQFRPAHFAAGT
jgi:hypothetical protein